MKVTLNIQKKHLYFLISLIIIISAVIVYAAEWQDAGMPPSHDTLWVKEIKHKEDVSGAITIWSPLFVQGETVVRGRFSALYIYLWDDDGDGYIDYQYVDNKMKFNTNLDCDDNNAGINPDADEIAGNNIDENCDGGIGASCVEGMVRTCDTNNKGTCKQGKSKCENGQWTSCSSIVSPASETCNGLDDDCDGLVDEGLACGVGWIPPGNYGGGGGGIGGGSPLMMKTAPDCGEMTCNVNN